MKKFLTSLVHIGGGDDAALELVPSARPVFRQMAAAVLFTAAMACGSMWCALTGAVRVPWGLALPIAVLWGLGIFVLDRTLMVVGMGGSRAGTISSVTGRLLAAALIGIVVSTPLTLRIFASDIDAQLTAMHAAQSAANKSVLAASQEQDRVDQLQEKVDEWESIQAGVLPGHLEDADSSALARQLADLQQQVVKDRHAADQAAILYNCDMYGGGRDQLDDPSKCATDPGPNGNAALYHAEAVAAAQTVVDDQERIRALQQRLHDVNADKLASLQSQAPAELATYRAQLSDARASLDDFESGLVESNRGDTGLLAQLKALWKAGEGSTGLMVAHLLIAMLFMLVEVLPVLAKLMWLCGRGGRAYEEAVASLDEAGLARAQSRRAAAQIQAETEFDAALIAQEAELEEKRQVAAHRREVQRITQDAEQQVEEALARDIVARRIAIAAELGPQREQELRRRAEADHAAWVATGRRSGNVTFARFGDPAETDRGSWASFLRWGHRRAAR